MTGPEYIRTVIGPLMDKAAEELRRTSPLMQPLPPRRHETREEMEPRICALMDRLNAQNLGRATDA